MQILIAKTPVTAADHGQMRPAYGIDFPAFGASGADQKKMPASVPGTFLDLLSPDIKQKGRDRQSFTFKAMTQAFGRALLRDTSGALMPSDKAPNFDITQELDATTLRELYSSTMPVLAKLVKVKRVGKAWSIFLPIFLGTLAETLTTLASTDDADSNVTPQDIAQRGEYVLPILRALGWRFDTATIKFELPLNRIATTMSSDFLIVNPFYNLYCKKFHIESIRTPLAVLGSNGNTIESLGDIGDEESHVTSAFISRALNNKFVARVEVWLPDDEASYYFQCPAKDIKATTVLDFFYRWYRYGFTSKVPIPTYTHPLTAPIKKNVGFTPKPKTNKSGLTLTSRNTILYVPEDVNKLAEYEQAYQDTAQSEDGFYTVSAQSGVDGRTTNQLLYVDWVSNKILYTGDTPNIQTVDLETNYVPGATTMLKLLHGEFTPGLVLSWFSGVAARLENALGVKSDILTVVAFTELNKIMDDCIALNSTSGNKFARSVASTASIAEYAEAALTFMYDIHDGDAKAYNQGDIPKAFEAYPVSVKDLVISSPNPLLRPLGKWIKQAYGLIMADPLKFINSCKSSPLVTMDHIGALIVMNEAPNFASYVAEDKKEREPYFTQDQLDTSWKASFKNSEGLKALQPHQAKVLNANRKVPKFSIVAVAAGGGKTIIAIEDIMRALEQGHVKRPLVICPAYLMKDYVGEVNYVSQGKTNVVVFDTAVFNSYSRTAATAHTGLRDYSKLKALVDNAPPNTIYVTGYDVYAKAGAQTSVYGGNLVYSNSHIEFMQTCDFDGVWMDESHFLKNSDSNRSIATETLIASIPYKRLLTGTITPNSLVDLVSQVGYFAPDILGNESQFRKNYSADGSDTGTFVARQGAEQEIYRALKNQCVFQNVQRKEWASLLPEPHEYFVPAYLTPNQKAVYDLLISEMMDGMESDSSMKSDLKAIDDSEDNPVAGDDIEHIFDKYKENLSAIESFLASPMSTVFSADMLTDPADQVSPKGKEVVEIIQRHLSQPKKYPGKIIVFCNTYASVEGIYREFPPELKAATILYTAESSVIDQEQFNSDDSKRIFLGISQSMETGLNLQIADTLIRVDNVWSPGRFEQGLARINRPNLKAATGDPRKATGLFMYYITVDNTIDVLKTARLTSKTVQIAKFYNAGTADYHHYEGIGLNPDGSPLEPIKVSMENLRAGLSYERDLLPYMEAYQDYRRAEKIVFDDYRTKNPNLVPVAVEHTGLLDGSKLLTNIPYTPGMSIFGADKLGLVPYTRYRREFIDKNGEDLWDPIGLSIHTAFGDGSLTKVNVKNLLVDLISGGSANVLESVAFVITKKTTSTKEIREQLVDVIGLEAVTVKLDNYRILKRKEREDMAAQRALEKQKARDAKKRAKEEKLNPVKEVRKDSKRKQDQKVDVIKPADKVSNKVINLYLTLTNEMITLATSTEDPDASFKQFKKYGFHLIRPYWYLEVKQHAALDIFIDKLDAMYQKDTIEMKEAYFVMLDEIYNEFKQGRSKLLHATQKTKTDIGHFLIDRRRKISNPLEVRPIPMVVDGSLYICMDTATHNPAVVQKIRRIKLPGAQWDLQDDTIAAFFTRKSEVSAMIKELKADGYTIENEAELKATFEQLKLRGAK